MVGLVNVVACLGVPTGPWLSDLAAPPAQRTQLLLEKLNATEKLHLLVVKPFVGIPALTLNDSPQGFRGQLPGSPVGISMAWPPGLTVGASWDVDLARAWGKGMGVEFAGKGSNVHSSICVLLIPNNERNFEHISGEDPFLGMSMVAVGNNNQETNRTSQTECVNEWTNFEIVRT
jgi:beta-glucosidase-like glycosyl hydrolase